MGYNTTVLVLNDVLGEIEKHPAEFVSKLVAAIGERDCSWRREFGVGRCANGIMVGSVEHADVASVLVSGGNMIVKVGALRPKDRGFHKKEVALQVLQDVVKQLKAEIDKDSEENAP